MTCAIAVAVCGRIGLRAVGLVVLGTGDIVGKPLIPSGGEYFRYAVSDALRLATSTEKWRVGLDVVVDDVPYLLFARQQPRLHVLWNTLGVESPVLHKAKDRLRAVVSGNDDKAFVFADVEDIECLPYRPPSPFRGSSCREKAPLKGNWGSVGGSFSVSAHSLNTCV